VARYLSVSHSPGGCSEQPLGLLNIVPQLLVIAATVIVFWRLDRIAGRCLAPLAIWVAVPTDLNFSIWSLNS
jgi:translocator protein